MLQVEIKSFSYSKTEILKNIQFSLQPGKHLAVLGESGCGKSTLLHAVYGLLHIEHGSILWENKKLLGPNHNLIPGENFIKLVAQEFNIMPFISVAENIATFLPRLDAEQDAKRVAQLLAVVDLQDFSDEMAKNLSGGQKQRVALAKALAKEPKLLLLDEPFSHIDSFRKNKLRRNLYTYLKENNISCITATHDSSEALAFSDTILMLKNGCPETFGTPQGVYSNLTNSYRASFFGETSNLKIKGKNLVLLPHQLNVSEEKTAIKVRVIRSFYKGSHYLIEAKHETNTIFFNHSLKLFPHEWAYLSPNRKV